jgi:inner membrane protein
MSHDASGTIQARAYPKTPVFSHLFHIRSMTRAGHIATGWGTAALAYAACHRFGAPHHAWLAAIAALPGATAPDWMEIRITDRRGRHRTMIAHRTWTHWLPLWIGALAFAVAHLGDALWAAALVGFALGGLTHLAVDLPNPLGIPVIWPTRSRFSLGLWKSGRMEMPLTLAVWAAGGYSLYVWRVLG